MIGFKEYFSSVKKNFKIKNFIAYFIIIFVLLWFSLKNSLGNMKDSTNFMVQEMAYTLIIAVSLSLVVGFLGELSLGQGAFVSIGAYIGGYMQTYVLKGLWESSPVLSLFVAMIIGGLVAAFFGFFVGLPALRLKGDYLAIVTLAFGEIVNVVFQHSERFGAELGLQTVEWISNKNISFSTLTFISLIMVLVTLIIIQNFIRSKHGRAVMAVRDSEIAAKSMGVNVTYYKLVVFVMAAFFAGIGGVLFSNAQTFVVSTNFNYNYSINILVMVVLGGMGNINGTMISSVFIVYLNTLLPKIFKGNVAVYKQLFYALILILIVIYNNAPKLKFFREKYSFGKLISTIKKKIIKLFTKKDLPVNPSKEKEYGADWGKIPTKIEMDAILSTDLKPDTTYVPDKTDSGGK